MDLKRVFIKPCNEITLSFKNNFENVSKSLMIVLAEIKDDEFIIPCDKNPTLKIDKDLHIPKSNIASYWID